jgi:hypothetical protein
MKRDWKAYGFGIAIRPFWWQLGHVEIAGCHWLHFGPFSLQWKLAPTPWRREQGYERYR